ncbi:hypothetical protein C8E86_8345 [Catellatospora citrea]|nr:hypothetical protein C8E86_8345 [Catellatospora citrea]
MRVHQIAVTARRPTTPGPAPRANAANSESASSQYA